MADKGGMERKALRLKKFLFIASILLLGAAFYFFKRHERYCEDNVYSMFALVEIIIVVCNIGFHATAMYDFSHCYLSLLDLTDDR